MIYAYFEYFRWTPIKFVQWKDLVITSIDASKCCDVVFRRIVFRNWILNRYCHHQFLLRLPNCLAHNRRRFFKIFLVFAHCPFIFSLVCVCTKCCCQPILVVKKFLPQCLDSLDVYRRETKRKEEAGEERGRETECKKGGAERRKKDLMKSTAFSHGRVTIIIWFTSWSYSHMNSPPVAR